MLSSSFPSPALCSSTVLVVHGRRSKAGLQSSRQTISQSGRQTDRASTVLFDLQLVQATRRAQEQEARRKRAQEERAKRAQDKEAQRNRVKKERGEEEDPISVEGERSRASEQESEQEEEPLANLHQQQQPERSKRDGDGHDVEHGTRMGYLQPEEGEHEAARGLLRAIWGVVQKAGSVFSPAKA